jgi:hypothetical protein
MAITVPLSAYNIVQEFTYRPNDTLPVVALSSLVPSVFKPSANSFTPQLLTVGDIIKLNGSLFEYTIVDAFDDLDETEPVSSFSYYNKICRRFAPARDKLQLADREGNMCRLAQRLKKLLSFYAARTLDVFKCKGSSTWSETGSMYMLHRESMVPV